jgi:hypothetical protein
MDGATKVAGIPLASLSLNWDVGAFADSTGDGKADIVWRGPGGETVLWALDGASILGAASIATVPGDWQVVG